MPLLTWGVVYLRYVSYHTQQPPQWLSIFRQASMYHHWFAYMIIGLYMVSPVLQAVYDAVHDKPALQWYLLVLWFVFTSVPTCWPIPLLGLLHLSNFFGYAGYFLIGAVLATRSSQPGAALRWAGAFVAGVVATGVLCSMWSGAVHLLYFRMNISHRTSCSRRWPRSCC